MKNSESKWFDLCREKFRELIETMTCGGADEYLIRKTFEQALADRDASQEAGE